MGVIDCYCVIHSDDAVAAAGAAGDGAENKDVDHRRQTMEDDGGAHLPHLRTSHSFSSQFIQVLIR